MNWIELSWMYSSRCVGVGVSVGGWQATLNHSFLKTFSVSYILSIRFFILIFSVASVCGFYWLDSFAHSHHCYRQRKNSSLTVSAKRTHLMITKLPTTTATLMLSRFIVWDFFSSFSHSNTKTFLFSLAFFSANFLFALNLMWLFCAWWLFKTIPFNTFETNRFWWSFYFIYIFLFGNWNKYLNMHPNEGGGMVKKRSVRKRCML